MSAINSKVLWFAKSIKREIRIVSWRFHLVLDNKGDELYGF